MIKLGMWNIRGLNASIKQREVSDLIRNLGLSLCCVVESRLKPDHMIDVCNRVFGRWSWMSNASVSLYGTRIICAWDPNMLSVMSIDINAQFINCEVKISGDPDPVFLSCVYGCNNGVERRELWQGLTLFKQLVRNRPWIVFGDFNAMLFPHDGVGGSSRRNSDMEDFHDCLEDTELFDINYQGVQYTWVQKPLGEDGLMRKLDRILGNTAFVDRFNEASAKFIPRGISDHSPGIVCFKAGSGSKRRPFKFDNFLASHDSFLPCVAGLWSVPTSGSYMKRVLLKLKALKPALRGLRSSYGNLDQKARALKSELEMAQLACDLDPFNVLLKEDVAHLLLAYQHVKTDLLHMVRQKSKVRWLNEGDGNTKFFFHALKERRNLNRIDSITDCDGVCHEKEFVPQVFSDYFESILGTVDSTVSPSMGDFSFFHRLSLSEALHGIRPISDAEIKEAMFGIGSDKAPGSDGYSSLFFKAAWSTVGKDVLVAVHNFFYSGFLEYEVNHTNICVIPKSPNASKVTEFRPISCCNVLLKCISKIIAERMKGYLNFLIGNAQSAFIPGRQITDNILMAHELVAGYQRGVGLPSCAFKIDIRKAYDTVNWDYLIGMLQHMGFHPVMVNWIRTVISSPSFSVSINGESRGFFKGKRGLRQGDPLSPYLFTIVMEGLSIILKKCIEEAGNFEFHRGCEDIKLTHLCFADDLFIFSRGTVFSVEVIKRALLIFKDKSGLSPSLEKSEVFFGNVDVDTKNAILNCLPFRSGVFPIRYLGVPLSPARLRVSDFNPLVVKFKHRLLNWKNKFLSYGGRRQLIISVFQSLQVFWMSVFLLPSSIVHEIEQICRKFLWANYEGRGGNCRVSWDVVCSSRESGGLGFKRVGLWNRCFLFKHIWDILTNRKSLWVTWVHSNCVKGRNFWTIKKRNEWSWLIRNLLEIRPHCRRFFISTVGNGMKTHAWEDTWDVIGPLSGVVSYRFVNSHGLHTNSTVYDLRQLFGNVWPEEWVSRFPVLHDIPIPSFSNEEDSISWLGPLQVKQVFSVNVAWRTLEDRGPYVSWYKVVWNKAFIPKHALCIWMACHKRLPTQDRISQWKHDPPDLKCVFCDGVIESHNHLFFGCRYSLKIWKSVKKDWNLLACPDAWDDILSLWNTGAWRAWSTLQRVAISATVYHVWMERNRQFFTASRHSVSQVVESIRKETLLRAAWKMQRKTTV